MKVKQLFNETTNVGTYTYRYYRRNGYAGPNAEPELIEDTCRINATTKAHYITGLNVVVIDLHAWGSDDYLPFDLPQDQRFMETMTREQAIRRTVSLANMWQEQVRECIPASRTDEEAMEEYRKAPHRHAVYPDF